MTGDSERARDGSGAAFADAVAGGKVTTPASGGVVWITGFPASGKTTVARQLVARLRERWPGTALLDGDELRAAFEHDLGYARDDRRRAARRYARLARLLAQQGLHVVVATVSLFEEIHRWNRDHLQSYLEVYLRVPLPLRLARDRRGVYAGGQVVGVDVAFDEPGAAHLVIDDHGELAPHDIAERIRTQFVQSLLLQRRR